MPGAASSSPDTLRLTLLSDGVEVPGTHTVHAVEVRRAFNRLPAATLTLHDGDAAAQDFALSSQALFSPGRRVEVRVGYHDRQDRIFDGIVVKHAVRARRGGRTTLTLECRHAAVSATLQRESAVFTDMTDADIIAQLLSRHGLSGDVAPTGVTHRQLVQAHATDWDFILQRAAANGLLVRVEDDGRVAVGPPDASPEPAVRMTFGADLFELECETDARLQPAAVTATAWDAATQGLVEANAEEPSFPTAGTQRARDVAAAVGGPTVRLRPGARLSESELKVLCDAWALRARLALTRGRLVCQGDARLTPGATAELRGAGQRFSGKVLVTAVRHQVSTESWQCDVQFGLEPGDGSSAAGPRSATDALVPAARGLWVGVVTAVEGDPDGEERIRVRLPLIDAAGEGVWARLSALDAGGQRGGVFRPEVDDEVIVGFVSDDPREPVVLGKLFSSARPAPLPASDDNPQKGFVTRSDLRLLFDDERRAITLSTPGGKSLSLSDDPDEVVLTDAHGNTVKLSSEGITLETRGALRLKATGDVALEGNDVEVQAQASLTATGNAGAELRSSGVSKLKGTLVQIN